MQNIITKSSAAFFVVASFYLYGVNPVLMPIALFLAWGFWRSPMLFPEETVIAKNKRMGFILVLILVAMTMFSYLMVPLFHKMCQALDIGGKVHSYQGQVKQTKKLSQIESYPVVTLYAGIPLKIDLEPKPALLPEYGEMQHVFVITNKSNRDINARLRLTISPSSATHFIQEITKYNNNLIHFTANEKKHVIVKYHINKDKKNSAPSIAMAYTFFEYKD